MTGIEWSLMPLERALERWRDEWHALVCAMGRNPSLLPGWVEVAAQALGIAAQVEVFVGVQGGQLVAIVPLRRSVRRQLGVPRRVVELGAGLVNYHYELVAQCEFRELLAALAEHLRRDGGWHVMIASNVPADSPTEAALLAGDYARAEVLREDRERSPYLPLVGDWESYLAGRNKAFRYGVRRQKRDLAAAGRAAMIWMNAPEQVEDLWKAVLHVEARSWKAREGRAISSRPHELAYNRELLPYLAGQGMLLANVLLLDDAPIAYSICCAHGGWVGHLKTSFDESFGRLRPGAAVIQEAVERSFAEGRAEFDFLGDAAPHKLEWTSHVRLHRDIFVHADGVVSRALRLARRLRNRVPTVGT